MGAHTELIFGAVLREDTPDKVIEALNYMLGKIEEKPRGFPLPSGRCEGLFQYGSYPFAVDRPICKMWLDDTFEEYHISIRSNIKNYNNEIETFLKWIRPYIQRGSGSRDMYAIVIHEEQAEPTIYYLREDK